MKRNVTGSIKGFVFFAALLLASTALAGQTFNKPTWDFGGVPHKLVQEDGVTGDYYWTDLAFCASKGFAYSSFVMSTLMEEGPYVILGEDGSVLQAIPAGADWKTRLYVIESIECDN